jgi:hypothetical protein
MLPGFTASYALHHSRQLYRNYGAWSESEASTFFASRSSHVPGNVTLTFARFGSSIVVPANAPPLGCGTLKEMESCLAWNEAHPYAKLPCELLYGPCEPPRICCQGVCTDVNNSQQHCGECNNGCLNQEVCCGGTCCGGANSGKGCCPWTSPKGACVDKLPNGQLSGEPFNKYNCGTCGTICPGVLPGCCGGTCVDFSNDWLNCGACNKICLPPATCQNGVCTCPDGKPLGSNSNCGACGQTCAGTCQNGTTCSCPNGTAACSDGSCPDFQTDDHHCGGCDLDCAATIGGCCAAGTCVSPPIKCNGVCTNVITDTNNCGSCGNKCPSPQTCQFGVCTCPDGSPLGTSSNCGGCGKTCTTGVCCSNTCGVLCGTSCCPAGTFCISLFGGSWCVF